MEELRILLVPIRGSASYPTRTVREASGKEKYNNSLYGILRSSSIISYVVGAAWVAILRDNHQSRTHQDSPRQDLGSLLVSQVGEGLKVLEGGREGEV